MMDLKFQTRRPIASEEQQAQCDKPKKHGALPEEIRNYGQSEQAEGREEQNTRIMESLCRGVEKLTDAPCGADTSKYKIGRDQDGNWEIQDGAGEWVAGPYGKDWNKALAALDALHRPKTPRQTQQELTRRVAQRSFAAGQERALAGANSVLEKELGEAFEKQDTLPRAYRALMEAGGRKASIRPVEDTIRSGLKQVEEKYKGQPQKRLQALSEMQRDLKDAEDAIAGAGTPEEKEQAAREMLKSQWSKERYEALVAGAQGKAGRAVEAMRRALDKALTRAYGESLSKLISRTNPDKLWNKPRLGQDFRAQWERLTGAEGYRGMMAAAAELRRAEDYLKKIRGASSISPMEIREAERRTEACQSRLDKAAEKIGWEGAKALYHRLATLKAQSDLMHEKVFKGRNLRRGDMAEVAEKESAAAKDILKGYSETGRRAAQEVTPGNQRTKGLIDVIKQWLPSWTLRAFAKAEEVRAALGILDEIQCLYDFSGKSPSDPYPEIKEHLTRLILLNQANFVRTIHSGVAVTDNPLREWVWAILSNIAADELESGRHHLTRGVLHPLGKGDGLLRLYDTATAELLGMGALDLNRMRRNKEILLLNIRSAE